MLVPGCLPIPEVMTAVVTYILTYDRLPPLDRMGRPKMFYGQRIHDKLLPPRPLRRRSVRREVRRPRRQARLLPLQGRLQGSHDLQRLLDRPLERRPLLARSVRPRLHRLLRTQLLRQGFLLQTQKPPSFPRVGAASKPRWTKVGLATVAVVGAAAAWRMRPSLRLRRPAPRRTKRSEVKNEQRTPHRRRPGPELKVTCACRPSSGTTRKSPTA